MLLFALLVRSELFLKPYHVYTSTNQTTYIIGAFEEDLKELAPQSDEIEKAAIQSVFVNTNESLNVGR